MTGGRVVVVGCSAGGLDALDGLLGGLGEDFPWPVAVVIHRGADSDFDMIRGALSSCARLLEAEDKTSLSARAVFIAPPDYHLLIDEDRLALSTEAPSHHARPSIDVLFSSAAALGGGAVGVILSGGGKDGCAGAREIAARGGLVFVQDPATAGSQDLPRAAAAALPAARVLPPKGIARALVLLAGGAKP